MQGNPPGVGYGPAPNPMGSPMSPAAVPSRRRGSRLAIALGVFAVLLAGAALGVSLIRKPGVQTAAPAPTPAVPAQQLFVDDADRGLCQAIAPLMTQIGEQNKAFAKLEPGSPEQGDAIPGYRSFIEGWANQIQMLLNAHSNPPRYLTRTLQAYIDDKLLYVELAQPGRVDPGDQMTWNQASIDAGGPLGTCTKLGITW